MQEEARLRAQNACPVECILDSPRQVVVCGQRLSEQKLSGCFVEGGEICERAAYVDGNSQMARFGRLEIVRHDLSLRVLEESTAARAYSGLKSAMRRSSAFRATSFVM